MSNKNIEIANIFNHLADLLELEGENPFRIRAYRSGATSMENLTKDVEIMVKDNEDLTTIPNIGVDLAQKIIDIVNGKEIRLLKELKAKNPIDYENLSKVQGLGPKRIKKLYQDLRITNLKELETAAANQQIRHLEGFSEKIEDQIINDIDKIENKYNRLKNAVVEEYAQPIVEYLKKDTNVHKIELAGSYRRKKETVGDIDILITCTSCQTVVDKFVNYKDVQTILAQGESRASVLLNSGIQVDLRVFPKESYGAALNYFTGSKAHNIALRKIAKDNDLKINEYGLFKGDERIAGESEEEIYKKLGLTYIEPELREDTGEIEAAKKNELPKLIKLSDIKGDLHTHTNATDGNNSLEEMAEAAKALGYEYIGNTEHSKRVAMAKGLDEKALTEHIKKIDNLNEKLKDFKILKGIEVDILEDGTLDLPDSILKELDIVIGAIHYNQNLPKEKQTERILKAMDNPYFNILAHPTGRLINQREGYDVDMEKIMKKAKDTNSILEINAHPSRLDLNNTNAKMAKNMGVKLSIATDAHDISGLKNMKYGVNQARRGWIEAKDVVNTNDLTTIKQILKK
ncbi:MAG: DNA polymerase/3'-5' exonuclease PolX [Candidatus Gastranaerophilales bacterium]|nr:DNA polymerase/3'-5' exonuclease PolX [Candidatus Gastranaerophilales bacterium]